MEAWLCERAIWRAGQHHQQAELPSRRDGAGFHHLRPAEETREAEGAETDPPPLPRVARGFDSLPDLCENSPPAQRNTTTEGPA